MIYCIKNNFWFANSFKALEIKYGIKNESKAIEICCSETSYKVVSSGLWINAKYLHLGANPDGLILDDSTIIVTGIVEVKCLKLFRGRSIEQIIQQKLPEQSRQYSKVVDNKILLKTPHSYYYDIQLQLWLLKLNIAIVLYSDIGKIYIKITVKLKGLQCRIIEVTKIFWRRVLIPEYFFNQNSQRTFSFYFVISIFNLAIYFRQ